MNLHVVHSWKQWHDVVEYRVAEYENGFLLCFQATSCQCWRGPIKVDFVLGSVLTRKPSAQDDTVKAASL